MALGIDCNTGEKEETFSSSTWQVLTQIKEYHYDSSLWGVAEDKASRNHKRKARWKKEE